MIKAIIIEDEPNALQALQKMLALLEPTIEVVATTPYAAEGIELINRHDPDIVFLDIELEDGTGFDVLEAIDTPSFRLVFTTAYDQHAIKAFKYNALDYLLKPLDPAELKQTLQRILSVPNNEYEQQKQLNGLTQKEPSQLVLKTATGAHFFEIENIIRLEAQKAYTLIVTHDERILASRNIKYYEELLGKGFIRCHQSHLVNVKQLKTFDTKSNILYLRNQDQITVSARKKAMLSNLFK